MDDAGDDRDDRGRFRLGHAPLATATPARFAITRELRKRVDPAQIADYLIMVATGRGVGAGASTKLRLEAIAMILDRTEGKPAQAIDLRAQLASSNTLPPNWDSLTPAERAAYLDNVIAPQLGSGRG